MQFAEKDALGMIYCIEYLAQHLEDWLKPKLEALMERERQDALPMGPYFVFDCPGQVELYTHNEAMLDIIAFLQKMDFRVPALLHASQWGVHLMTSCSWQPCIWSTRIT